MKTNRSLVRELLRTPTFSPRGLIARALFIVVAFGICHWMGWREYTTFISGSPVDAAMDRATSTWCAVTYMAGYFGVVVVAPILFISGVILSVWDQFSRKPDTNGH